MPRSAAAAALQAGIYRDVDAGNLGTLSRISSIRSLLTGETSSFGTSLPEMASIESRISLSGQSLAAAGQRVYMEGIQYHQPTK